MIRLHKGKKMNPSEVEKLYLFMFVLQNVR